MLIELLEEFKVLQVTLVCDIHQWLTIVDIDDQKWKSVCNLLKDQDHDPITTVK